MTDSEHEYLLENETLRAERDRCREIAIRALTAAIESQDTATGHHDAWLDAELESLRAVTG